MSADGAVMPLRQGEWRGRDLSCKGAQTKIDREKWNTKKYLLSCLVDSKRFEHLAWWKSNAGYWNTAHKWQPYRRSGVAQSFTDFHCPGPYKLSFLHAAQRMTKIRSVFVWLGNPSIQPVAWDRLHQLKLQVFFTF